MKMRSFIKLLENQRAEDGWTRSMEREILNSRCAIVYVWGMNLGMNLSLISLIKFRHYMLMAEPAPNQYWFAISYPRYVLYKYKINQYRMPLYSLNAYRYGSYLKSADSFQASLFIDLIVGLFLKALDSKYLPYITLWTHASCSFLRRQALNFCVWLPTIVCDDFQRLWEIPSNHSYIPVWFRATTY